MAGNDPVRDIRRKNRLVAFIEFCGKHPFATGLFAILGVVGLVFSIYATVQSNKDTENIQKTVSDVQSIVQAACKFPPCWSAEQAIVQLLGSTMDYVDSKAGVPGSRTASGWHYKVNGCPITVHYVHDAVAYFSHPLSSSCPFSWKEMYGIDKRMPSQSEVTVGHLLDAVISDAYPPPLHIATGCTNCGNWHEPFIEFRVPGPHASDFYDRYFTTRFNGVDGSYPYDNDEKFEQRLAANTSLVPAGTMRDFCDLEVRNSVAEALRGVRIDRIGYGRGGWRGRQTYPIDVCHEGYVAGPP